MLQYIIFINSTLLLTSIFFFNYHSQDTTQNKLIYKIKNLEQEINEIHVVLDILEEKFDLFKKQISTLENNITNNINILQAKNLDPLQDKTCFGLDPLDHFITSNYDIVK